MSDCSKYTPVRTERFLLGCLGKEESVAVVPQDVKKRKKGYVSVAEDTFLPDGVAMIRAGRTCPAISVIEVF